MSGSGERPSTPRLAATMLVLRDDPLRVLMVRRHAAATFASALVFPGGTLDAADASLDWLPLLRGAEDLPEQERALRIAALRETWEETALLLVEGGAITGAHTAANTPFRQAVEASGGRLSLGELVPFGHWVTPAPAPKRFDTRFYLARAPDGGEAAYDGIETVALEWARPADLLARFAAGERSILFPTRMNLKRLAESDDSAAALMAARLRTPYRVEPLIERRAAGTATVIPAEAGYGETEDYHMMLN